MYCTQCGFKLEDADLFCARCGKPTRPDAPPRAEAPRRKLVRPMREKKIAGVCAGFADYFELDVTLMRILWLVAALFTGIGFIAYLIAWIAMPKDYSQPPAQAY
ncbi:MAG: PspC domain-containing protein [Bryobacteraceae bacterium]